MIKEFKNRPALSDLGMQAEPPVIVDLMVMALQNPNLLSMAAGFTSNAMLPLDIVQATVAKLNDEGACHLQYGTNQGRPGLRKHIAQLLETFPGEASSFDADCLLVGNGSQQALYLAMQALCNRGDIIFVESPSYFVYLELLRGLGIQAISIPTSDAGQIDWDTFGKLIEQLKAEGKGDKIKGIYLVSYYSNPSSRSLPASEKEYLGTFLKEKDLSIVVMEDAAYREVFFDKPYPSPTIESIDSLADFTKLYFGSFSKSFSSGLKVGYAYCEDHELLSKMLYIKGHHDFGSANFNQAIVETMFEEGLYKEQLKKQSSYYADKAKFLSEALALEGLRELGWSWTEPEGGLFIWLQAPKHLDLSQAGDFCKACIENGVFYVPGDLCFAERTPKHFARVSFGPLSKDELTEAAKRLASTAKAFAS